MVQNVSKSIRKIPQLHHRQHAGSFVLYKFLSYLEDMHKNLEIKEIRR